MKNYILLAIISLIIATTYQMQAQEGRYIEVFGTAQRTVQPDEIFYSVSINVEKFYAEYEYSNEYEQFDPVKYREIQDKVELRANSAKKQLMEIFEKNGINDQEVQSNRYNLIDRDVYTADSYLIKVSEFETLEKLVDQLRAFDIFQGHIVRMIYSGEEKIIEELKLEALKKASVKAQKMAKVLNANIGAALQIRESKNAQSGEPPFSNIYYDNPDYYTGNRPSSSPAPEQTIQLNAEIWVRFALM